MQSRIAIILGALCISTAHAATFIVEVTGVVEDVSGQGGGVLDTVQVGDAVTETFAFDTARFTTSTGDGATFLSYANSYLPAADAVRSRITVGALPFSVEGYPLLEEGAIAYDSLVLTSPPAPPTLPTDRFAVADGSVSVALNVAGAQGLVRLAEFTATAPGESSLVTVPVTAIDNVRLADATSFSSALFEGVGRGLEGGGVAFNSANARVVFIAAQSATLRRCEGRLQWLDAGQPWPKHGTGCESAADERDNHHNHRDDHNGHDRDRHRDRDWDHGRRDDRDYHDHDRDPGRGHDQD